jgi:hypothetical protein
MKFAVNDSVEIVVLASFCRNYRSKTYVKPIC